MKRIAGLLTTVAVAASLAACGGGDGASEDTTAGGGPSPRARSTIGVADQSKEYWRTFEQLAADEGIEVELVNFTDYTQPNPILSQGDLDLNQFQHLLYLANYNVAADDDLIPIGSTAIYQLGLYTTKGYESPDDIPDGAEIAIPNDVVNQARALLVLQSAGLIELRAAATRSRPRPRSTRRVPRDGRPGGRQPDRGAGEHPRRRDHQQQLRLRRGHRPHDGDLLRPGGHHDGPPVPEHLGRARRGRRQPHLPQARRDLPVAGGARPAARGERRDGDHRGRGAGRAPGRTSPSSRTSSARARADPRRSTRPPTHRADAHSRTRTAHDDHRWCRCAT